MNWWWARDNERHGPVDEASFRQMVERGELRPDDLVWNESMATWLRASQVPGLLTSVRQTAGVGYEGEALTPNRRLMEMARESLSGWWGSAIGAILLIAVIQGLAGFLPFLGGLIGLILAGPFQLGLCSFFLRLARRENPKIEQVFSGFKQFGPALGAYCLVAFFTFLWTLLLIVPGIVKAYAYSQTFFILADNPGIGPMEAIDRSMALMDGRKWKLFCLYLRFVGWALLCVLTCGIGFLWWAPYVQTSLAHFYDDIRGRLPAPQP